LEIGEKLKKKILLISTLQPGAYSHVIYRTLVKMGHDVFPFDQRVIAVNEIDHHFEYLTDFYEPDVIFAVKGRGLSPHLIKESSALTINWWLDNAKRFSDFRDFYEVYDKMYLIEEGQGYDWMSIGIDPDVHKPTPFDEDDDVDDLTSEVVFAGTAHFGRSDRIYKSFLGLPHNIAIWGNDWPKIPHVKGRAIYFYDLMKVYTASKLIFNAHYYKGITPNMRCIEATCTGTTMISDTGRGINKILKKGKEYIPYDSPVEARYLINKYMEEPEARDKIGQAALKRVYKDHLLEDKLAEMIKE
jgi:glycosyltransferase involved in cell wall biosynthesis